MKRGITTFPFLLIFVLIAGAFILMFFFGFGSDILSFSNKLNALSLAKSIDQQLAAFTFSSNAYNTIQLRETEVSISCTNKKTTITVDGRTIPTEKLILAPEKLKGETLKAWTYAWYYPFKIENLYFLSNPNIVYYFQNPITQEEKKFKDNFEINFVKLDISSLSPSSTKAVVILFNTAQNNHLNYINMPNVLKVVKLNLNLGTEQIVFCNPNCQPFPYLGDAMAYAAILADSPETFACIKEQAVDKLNTITKIYEQKVENLKRYADNSCIYETEFLQKLKQPDLYPEAVKKVEEHNENLIIESCPSIYAK